MNLRQLESFLTIAQLGSFAAAAERLHLTQSTISARIQELEQDLGVVLFDRSQRQIHLTVKGRALVGYAEQALGLFAEIKNQVGSRNSLSGIIRIGVVELVAISWLPNFAASLRNEYPNLLIEFEVGLNPFLVDGVRTGELDIAIIAGQCPDSSFSTMSLGKVRFSWMASPTLNISDDVLEVRDLRRWPIIYQGAESFINQTINQSLGIPNTRKPRGTSCNSLGAIASLTVAGVGISLMPVPTFASMIEEGKLKVLRTVPEGIDMPFSVIYARQDPTRLFSHIATLSVEASTFEPESAVLA